MDDSIVKTIVTIIGTLTTAGIGTWLFKFFLAYTGWKKEVNRSMQDELYKMIDSLKEERKTERLETDKKFDKEREDTEKETAALRKENRECWERDRKNTERIARLEMMVESLVDRIKLKDPSFVIRPIVDIGSGLHSPLKEGYNPPPSESQK